VGRGPFTSHCLLLTHQKYDPTGRIKLGGEEESREDARRRLKVLIEQSDGFVIAEEDLLLRGPGEFYGTRQHGLPDFRLARMVRDVKLVEEAREIAFWVTEQDPELRRPEHAVLRGRVEEVRARMDRIAG
jgi:ATP-dependent DNA helicase RecG